VMGRHAGWVALHTGIAAGADWILLPEVPLDLDAMTAHLKVSYARKGYGIVVASEGVELPHLDESEAKLDAFGHVILGDRAVGEFIAKEIETRTGIETRSAVTGHIQRGGPPSAFDRVLASRLGIRAAQCVYEKDFGKMVAIHGTDIVPVEQAQGFGHRGRCGHRVDCFAFGLKDRINQHLKPPRSSPALLRLRGADVTPISRWREGPSSVVATA